ncbi:MAG: DUF4287 domain-containing protein [Longimicrobiales bacterium]
MAQDQTMIDRLEEQTGRTLPQWKKILAAAGLEKHGQMVSLLKKEHGVTHGYANLIVHEFRAAGAEADDDPVTSQYEGKESLRPIYDRILEAVEGFGSDVEVEAAGSWNAMVSHRVRLTQPAEVDETVVGWLRAAYDEA